MKGILVTILLTTLSLEVSAQTCSKLRDCIELASKLTSKKYVVDGEIKGSIDTTKNFAVTKENADDFISEALNLAGFTRIPSLSKDTWIVINARDVRYHATPHFSGDLNLIPNNFDHVTVQIKPKNKYIVSSITRNFRPFMSRYGRIIDFKHSGEILIADSAKNVRRLLKIIEKSDREPTAKEIKEYEKSEKRSQKLKELRIKYGNKKSKI